MSDNIISYHTFMLPLTFEGKFDKKANWKYQAFEIEENRDYNEFIYFYKHVQDALFNNKDDKNPISRYFEYMEQEGTYTIECMEKNYTLKVDGISLRIFNTDVAILSFNLINTQYKDPKDILAINEFGRRIYPQFLGEKDIKDTKQAFLAKSITLSLVGEKKIKECFYPFYSLKNLDEKLLPSFVTRLINQNFAMKSLRPIIDDRMFVISQYNSDRLVKKLQKYKNNNYIYETDSFWYKYIFIDGKEKTCQHRAMTKDFIAKSTYGRWVEWGTLFGMSRYSFVALTGSWFGKERLLPHMQTIYFQIFTLLLAYRASIISFSDEIQNITSQKDEELVKNAQTLYRKYLNFLNKLYFKEVTAQDQGIELYNQAMEVMEIPKYMKDLDNEINELHSYVRMIEEQKTAQKMNQLTMLGGFLLPASLVTGFLGMNTLGDWVFTNGWNSFFLVVASASILPVYFKFFKKGES